MFRPPASRRQDVLLWSLSAACVLAAVLCLFGGGSPRPDAGGGSGVPRLALADASPIPVQPISSAPADARLLAFRERLTALRPLQAAMLRIFQAPPPVLAMRRTARVARVRPGGTPEACLAQAVYYEARGEPAEGQAAVAQVVLNRTRSGRHPADVCGAVFEGASRRGCQFSFACDSRLAGRRVEPAAWRRSQQVAAEVMAGGGPASLRTATNYHADYVRPRWAAQLERTAEIGRHIFYASTSAATRALSGWTFTAPAPSAGA